MQAAEPAQDARQVGTGRILGQAKQDAARQIGLGEAEQRFVMQTENAIGIGKKFLALRRERRQARLAGEKVAIEAGLQALDLVADSGLRQPERFGRTGDTAMVADRPQGAQRIDLERTMRDRGYPGKL
jgi:hypothetical protein